MRRRWWDPGPTFAGGGLCAFSGGAYSIADTSTQISFFTQVLSRGQCEFRFRHRVQKARRREGLRDFDLHNDRNRPKPRRARAFCRRFFSKRSSICTIFCRFFATVPKSAFLRRFYQEVSANFVFDIVYKKPDAERAFAISTYTMTETDRNRGGRGRFADAFLARGLRYARFFVDFSLLVSA